MYQLFRRIFVLSWFVLFSLHADASVAPPPVNDDQCNATLLTMTNPDSCPTWDIDTISFNGDNTFATSDTLASFFFNCQSGGNTPLPPNGDIWYKFVAPAERAVIVMNGLNTNALTLYLRQTTCMGLLPINCDVSSIGSAIIYSDVMIPGEVYYLQVCGGNLTDQGQFTLTFFWQHPCLDCIQDGKLVANPPPVNGYYHPGDTVEFVYQMRGYKPFGQDLFHGLSPDFGPGWDISSFTAITSPPIQPASGVGTWAWFTGIIDYMGNPVDGFFYDGPPNINGIPGDNKGDLANFFSVWTFRWKITTIASCTGAQDLSVNIYHYSDYETGSGTNPSCKNDADYHFKATLNCCKGPVITIVPATCSTNPTGTAIINIPTLPGPYALTVYDQTGNIVYTVSNSPTSIFPVSLSQGNYVAIVHNGTCFSSQQFHMSSGMEFTTNQTTFSCGNSCVNTANIQGPTGPYTFTWQPTNQTGPNATGLCAGTHSVIVTNTALGCTDIFYVNIINYPPDDPTFFYTGPNAVNYCTIDTVNPSIAYLAQPGGTFTWNGPPGNIDPITGEILLFPFINPGSYTVTYTTGGPCTATRSDSLFFVQSPISPFLNGPTSFCLDQQPITYVITNPQPFTLLVWDLANDLQPPFTTNPIVLNGLSPGPDTIAAILYDINTQCYSFPTILFINVFPLPTASAGIDTTVCPGFSTSLSGSGGGSYQWSPTYGLTNPNVQFPIAMVSTTTMYTLLVTDQNGCQNRDSVNVFVNNAGDCDLGIWTGISPNGDGFNESWFIEGIETYPGNTVQVFNRWGDLVWHTSEYNNRTNYWSGTNQGGKLLPAGTYYFIIQRPQEATRSGWVEITH